MPPVRNKIDCAHSIATGTKAGTKNKKVDKETEEKMKKYRRDNTAMPDYYKTWEKFAKNMDSDSEEEEAVNGNKIKPVKVPEPQT
jgi:hypothetical protein